MACSLWAVANYAIYLGKSLPDFDEAKRVGKCIAGSCLNVRAIIELFDVNLKEADDANEVLDRGGILNIWHPIVNGHSLLCLPRKGNEVYLINSWLGPVVQTTNKETIYQFTSDYKNICLGNHWVVG